ATRRPGAWEEERSVAPGEHHALRRVLAGEDAATRLLDLVGPGGALEAGLRDVADRDLELLLDVGLGRGVAAPVREGEAAADLLRLLFRAEEIEELLLRGDDARVRVAVGARLVEEAGLDVGED